MKYLAIILLVAAAICAYWGYQVNWADGSLLCTIICAVIALGIMVASYARTGKAITNDAGGH